MMIERFNNYRLKGLRAKLVSELHAKGIRDRAVLAAIGRVPRHSFLDEAFQDWAYRDIAFPIDAEQTISQPFTVARQTELLELKQGDKVLEIGTGSGYQAAVIFEMGIKIYSIERIRRLYSKTNLMLNKIGYGGIRTLLGDGFEGSERFAPYDKIIITAGVSHVPEQLVQQLKVGGYMVLPLGQGEVKKMTRLHKTDDGYTLQEFGNYSFVPMLEGMVA